MLADKAYKAKRIRDRQSLPKRIRDRQRLPDRWLIVVLSQYGITPHWWRCSLKRTECSRIHRLNALTAQRESATP